MDLKCFDTETFFADRGKLLEFLHGGFLFDYYYSLSYGCDCLRHGGGCNRTYLQGQGDGKPEA
ncbi:hypothetical protein PO366_26655, partial [Bacteroides ovatus]|nr:hypothetical protein [Bacteroides ovatus]